MAINSLSTGFRPGVCTSGTRPTAPYEGQVIYETDTDLSYVWGGAAWQQVSGGTAVGNSGLVYITSGTFSGTTAIDGIFTSTYDNYRIVVANMGATSNGLSNFNFRNTSNATDSSNAYFTVGRRYDTGTNYDFSQGALTYATTAINVGTAANSAFIMDIFTPRTTSYTMVSIAGTGTITNISSVQSSSYFGLTTQFAGIVFGQSAGSLNAGTYTVFGYRKA